MTKFEAWFLGRELGICEELISLPRNEDGDNYGLLIHRHFEIDHQAYHSGSLQDWAIYETYDGYDY